MKNRAGVIALVDVFQKLRDRERRALGIQLDGEIAHRGHHLHLRVDGDGAGLASAAADAARRIGRVARRTKTGCREQPDTEY